MASPQFVRDARIPLRRVLYPLLAVALLLSSSATVRAETPTPTPQVIDGEFFIVQRVTYGEGGIIVALLFIAGLMMLYMLIHLAERFADR